ncbi:NADH pyrophosphatase [Vanrija albida]|uniref:NAD(+) diphosphatase n=1 Tax=Vanrija albida TaxID=181172 RepID=A0ABR3QE98_9TREE
MSDIPNYYSGQPPLNRLSFQRPHADILNRHLETKGALFTVYNKGNVLVHKGTTGSTLFVTYDVVKPLIGGGFQTPPASVDARKAKVWESSRLPNTLPSVVFLGLDERGHEQSGDLENPAGTPYFAVDASTLEWDPEAVGGEWGDARANGSVMSPFEAGVFALARHLIDWNWRNKFCPACGSQTYSLWGGWKRACITAVEPVEGKEPCFSTTGLHNFAYPRTDPVIIMGILNAAGTHMLLGRQKSWPKGMYSCLAGFIEPGESFEDAVRREVYEEAGIEVGPVRYSSSQPWPYPANVMVGCFGRAKDGQTIRLDLDNELEDAQFFPRELVRAVASTKAGTTFSREDLKQFDNAALDENAHGHHGALEKQAREAKADPYAGFTRVPPETAIAGQLMRLWANGAEGLDIVSRL